MKHAGRINKKLTMAILLALTLGTSLPVYAEQMEYIKDKTLTQGDWELEEKLLMENSTVTANKVSLDGSSVPADNDPVMLYRSTLEGKKGIQISNLTVKSSLISTEGVYLQSSTLAAPTISISGLTSSKDSQASSFHGLFSEQVEDYDNHKMEQNHLKTDWLHVDGVTTDTALSLYGALLETVDLSPYTEGGEDQCDH